jgi:hypothetical protein
METKNKHTGKFMIAYDTLCEGWQCAKDEDENPDPILFDSYNEAMVELFGDAIDMLINRTAADREEVGVSEETFEEMKAVFKTGDASLMKSFLNQNENCNYNDEFIIPADEFILGRQAIFGSEGLVITGKKLS